MATLASVNGRGVVASRPAAGTTGQMYYSTDVGNGVLQRDNGTSFDNQGPVELGYAQITANQTGISATVATDLTGLTLTVTVGSRPIMVEMGGWQYDAGSTAGGTCYIYLIDVTASAQIAQGSLNTGDGGATSPNLKVRVNPAAGSRTYKAQGRGDGSTAARFLASATQPGWIRIYEV